MNIKGFIKTSLLDYPGHICATIFTGGCNFACPFCHNRDLALGKVVPTSTSISEDEVLQALGKRKKVLDGVCITGGEPTLQSDLISFIKKVRRLGLKVKLDTNGYHPDQLALFIRLGILDYIAMDIKNVPSKYELTAGVPLQYEDIATSIGLISHSGIPHEFRTTVVKELHDEDDIMAIANGLDEDSPYYLQQFRACDTQIQQGFTSYEDATLATWQENINARARHCQLRGVNKTHSSKKLIG